MERLILVVDFGTSNVHVNMVNCENGEILFSVSEKYNMICPQSGYVELDPDEMWEKSQTGVEKIIADMYLSGKAYRIEALSFSFFGDNIIPADEKGNALYHLIQCFDVRGKSQAEQLNLAVGEEKLIQVTGDVCESTSCSSKIRYILEEMPDVGRHAVRFYNIQQFILHRLGLPPVNDLTMACTKRMVDLEHGEWYEPLLKEVGITKHQLGRIVNSQDVIGKVDSYGRVKFPEPVSVIPGAHDCDCGWLGVGVTDEKQDVIGNITGTFEHFGFLASGYRNVYASHPQWGLYSYRGPLKDTSVMLTAFDTSDRRISSPSHSDTSADALLAGAGLLTGNVTAEASDTVEEGLIISQSELPGTILPPGTAVDYVVSGKPAQTQASDERYYIGSIDEACSLSNYIGPASQTSSVRVLIRLNQTNDEGASVYTTLMSPRLVVGAQTVPVVFPRIKGAYGVDSGMVEVVDADNLTVIKSYPVAFFPVG